MPGCSKQQWAQSKATSSAPYPPAHPTCHPRLFDINPSHEQLSVWSGCFAQQCAQFKATTSAPYLLSYLPVILGSSTSILSS
ncbi:hypothetical protein COCOBI_03-0180 [Coccomyxa sp. Obi]|nr:hypothetical protein COCOBI_03-0180 [Coccomyxa sp. Obi]